VHYSYFISVSVSVPLQRFGVPGTSPTFAPKFGLPLRNLCVNGISISWPFPWGLRADCSASRSSQFAFDGNSAGLSRTGFLDQRIGIALAPGFDFCHKVANLSKCLESHPRFDCSFGANKVCTLHTRLMHFVWWPKSSGL